MAWLLYALATIGAFAVLSRIYVILIPEPADSPPKDLGLDNDATLGGDGDPDLARWYAPLVGASVLEGNSVEHLRNGDEIFPAMLKAIDEAEVSVHFLTYVYWTGDIAVKCATALKAAAARGCEVRIVLDAAGAYKMDRKLVADLESGGCRVAWFHPFDWYSLRRVNHRTHRKILVVDGKVGFTGGVGIAEEWEGNARNVNEWRDDHFRVTGPCVHNLQGAFAENWLNSTGEFLGGDVLYPDPDTTGTARVVSVATARRDNLSKVLVVYWLALRGAQSSVDITTPYFVPDASLIDAFKEATARGVRVRLLFPNELNDSRLARWTSLALYPALLEAGVEICEFQPTMIHSKLVMVDDRWSVIGSANFDNRSFELNHEFVMLIDDSSLNTKLREGFEVDLARSVPIEQADFTQIKWWKRWVAQVGLLFREQL